MNNTELKKTRGLMTELDAELWNAVVERVMVNPSGSLTFLFKNGEEVTI